MIDGILHRVRTGVRWRDLPERFGPWKTVHERHRLRSADGTWERMLQQVRAAADAAGEIDWDISVDSTIVRAHQHAAGARTDPPPAAASKGAGPVEHRGETPGGFTTELHLSADGNCRPLSLMVTPGERADCTRFGPVLEKIRVPRPGAGEQPRKKPDSVSADKAIPEKADSQAARLRRGARGGRPPGFDEGCGHTGFSALLASARHGGGMLLAMHEDPQEKTMPGWWGRIACIWAVAFAVLHFYWALGGSWGLSVSAGPLAEERPGWFVAVGLWGVGMLCLVGGVLGWLLARPRPRGRAGQAVKTLGWCVCAVLVARGIAVEVLLLTDTAGQEIDVSPEQRLWTLVLWNPWFMVGGLVFGVAARQFGRASGPSSGPA
ncbi:IS5 family transposase [Streptomyces scopuliridis]|uniref:IS5 family transposase n=1 Tax=Streptomyces scopuliridis TaxID=452529 RepID=UPI002DDC50BA|nr:IS5 family transposase [Streptomyces scopuliridis]WSB38275.1 IS5 family transposase [Streptomyces scopuliridis]